MKLCVMGLGYIGLPTAVMFAEHGLDVYGVDINEKIIHDLQNGKLHIKEPGLVEKLSNVMKNGKLTVSTKPTKADVYIIAVPSPISLYKKVNLSYVESAANAIVPYLEKGNLVILESTVPPRTIEDKLIHIFQKSGLRIGEELLVSHSPERVIPGKLFDELIKNDRIVGGINEESSVKTAKLYKQFVKGEIHMTDATTAELVKLIENIYRDVNIALANELVTICEVLGINVWDAINLANYHPRVNIHKPGPGVGGHCIAVDPWFIIEQTPEQSALITLARKINESTPYRIVQLIESVVKDIENPTITLFGLAYKGNIDDVRESPSLVIMSELSNKGYPVKVHDPHVKTSFPEQKESISDAINRTDCLVILTDHDEYKNINFNELTSHFNSKNIIDTRNILNHDALRNEGFSCLLIGTPTSKKFIGGEQP